jgi:urease alpha subunit
MNQQTIEELNSIQKQEQAAQQEFIAQYAQLRGQMPIKFVPQTGLDADLKEMFNAGLRNESLLIQVVRELRKLTKSVPTTEAPPDSPAPSAPPPLEVTAQ